MGNLTPKDIARAIADMSRHDIVRTFEFIAKALTMRAKKEKKYKAIFNVASHHAKHLAEWLDHPDWLEK